jgi:hypothetical protein
VNALRVKAFEVRVAGQNLPQTKLIKLENIHSYERSPMKWPTKISEPA